MNPKMLSGCLVLACLIGLPGRLSAEAEIGFIERFALADDRSRALGELIPGSDEYYFFHCLHYQSSGQTEPFNQFLEQWRKRIPERSERRRIIENRKALLAYDASPQETLAYLKCELGVTHHHQQEPRNRKPNLPTALNPEQVQRSVFEADVLSNDNGLSTLSEEALELLVRNQASLRPPQRRALLSKIDRPDVPHLVELIATELKSEESRGFGEFKIHGLLLPEQLDALASELPALKTQTKWVFARVRKLAPSADDDIAFDPAARNAWLQRMADYVRALPPAFNTLKAHVFYQQLDHDRKQGRYDAARFLEYLKLPRPVVYINPRWLEQRALVNEPRCDLNADLTEALLRHQPIGNDEPLVREYFLALFDQAAKAQPGALGVAMLAPYTDYVLDTWLKPVMAEALIVGGHGSPEQWASLLNPNAFQQLRERVDIDFPATNATFFKPDEPIGFEVVVKNTPKLLVKIYEVNSLNYFLTAKRQLNTDLNLDGLVANDEKTHAIESGPFKRVRQTFNFPELKGRRGAWVVEFIGGGRSSRALVRVGQYEAIQQSGPAGDLLWVIDEYGQPVSDAVAWLDGRKFTTDPKLGRITIPFTQQPGVRPVVLSDPSGSFASLTQFMHHAENYQLDARFHVGREQLLAGRDATLALRTALLLGEAQLDPAMLLEPRLLITSTTLDGISTSQEIKDLKLKADRVWTHGFRVPDRLARLTATLSGKIEVLSAGGEKRDLSASQSWDLNGIDKTEATQAGYLSNFSNDNVYELLGKNGEPIVDQQVVFRFFHRGFGRPETIALKTDERGRIQLGALPGIEKVAATPPDNRESQWPLDGYERSWPSDLHVIAGHPMRIPWPGDREPSVEALSLLEMRADTFVADHADKLSIRDGFIEIRGMAPGDYALRLRADHRNCMIRVADGREFDGWIIGKNRNLQLKNLKPLQITGIEADDASLTVRVGNPSPMTRVHVMASRFDPGNGLFGALGGFMRFGAGTSTFAKLPNLYSEGRQIGDEYRYILDRRYGKSYPGNMLTRPGILLNPWDIRDTGLEDLGQAGMQRAGVTAGGRGNAFGLAAGEAPPSPTAERGAAVGNNMDFLARSAPVMYNLLPDDQGVVRVERKTLGDRQHIQIYVEDLQQAVWESYTLPEANTAMVDQRLLRPLDPAQPFGQRKDVTVLDRAKSLTLADTLTSEMATYDTLARVHGLLSTLNSDATLAKFAWILQWPKLKDDERRAKYAEFACHELNFFLARKDPGFFSKVIRPTLVHKKDKTFMDDYLIESNLAAYLEPSAYARLNVLEQALLAQRLPKAAATVARSIRERWEMMPPNPDEQDRLFETALRGRALEKPRGFGGGVETKNGHASKLEGALGKPAPAMAQVESDAYREADVAAMDEESEKKLDERAAKRRQKNSAIPGEAKKLNEAIGGDAVYDRSLASTIRAQVRAYFRQVGPTKEWAENNYYRLRITQQDGNLIPVSGFWRDYAAWVAGGAKGPFVSARIAEAHHHFAEMMLALAVLDLPFDAPEHRGETKTGQFTFTAAGPVIVFHKEIKPAALPEAAAQGQLLVSQSFFRASDRFRIEGNEKFEKYVTGEFLTGVVYGANIVVTNPTSAPVKADVLLQIPEGAMPVLGSKKTDSRSLRLDAYTTKTFEYMFYFPVTGKDRNFAHFPVNVAVNGNVAGAAKPFGFNVVTQLSQIDKASWDYISQYGSADEVFTYLEQNNLRAIAWPRIAWRCHEVGFFKKLWQFLANHHIWDPTIYSYALLHNDKDPLREWILHQDGFVNQCGPYLASPLVLMDPIERRSYEHLEYSPLVNQRAHRLGNEARIANPALLAQYRALLNILAHKPKLDAVDSMTVAYYLFLQDRVEDALKWFHRVDPKQLPSRLQHDYFACYAGFYENQLAEARQIASRHTNDEHGRWRALFAEITRQLDEIEGKSVAASLSDRPDREKQQSELAATEPSFDFKVENKTLNVHYRNLTDVTVNYYLMDPEFSFSSNPFVSEDPGRFSIIKPSETTVVKLPAKEDHLEWPLPARFTRANVLVELVAAGQRKAQAYHANSLKLTLAENYGRLELRDQLRGTAVSKAYVKVYARLRNGTVRFFKDGYTDLRGRFDYASLNSSGAVMPTPPVPMPTPRATGTPENGLDYQMLKGAELPEIEKFAILILSEDQGAITREVETPRE